MLSEINLSLVKADWCSVIMDGSSFLRRFARTLEYFVKHVTKANGAKLVSIFRKVYFWDKCNKSMI